MKIIMVKTVRDDTEYILSVDHIALVCPQSNTIIIDATTGNGNGVLQLDEDSMNRIMHILQVAALQQVFER